MERVQRSLRAPRQFRRYRECFAAEEGDEKLINALAKGPDEVAKVLKEGVRIEARDWDGDTALMVAAENGYLEVAKVLLQHGADVNGRLYEGNNVMHSACKGGHADIVKLLIESGAKIDEFDDLSNSTLQIAVKGGNEKVVQLLLEKGANLEEPNGRDEMTALHFAAKAENEKILEVLLNGGANIEAKCKNGKTAVFYACAKGFEKNVKILLQRGAKIDARDKDGETCLKAAIRGENESLVNFLLDSGLLDINEGSEYSSKPLYVAVRVASETMIQLLLDRGAVFTECLPDNSQLKSDSILHNACERGFESIVKKFLELGVNIQTEDERKTTVLHKAVSGGKESIVKVFLDHGIDVSSKDSDGRTPLHLAAESGHSSIIELLLSYGSDINEKDNESQTALYLAVENDHVDAFKLLLERGASINFRCKKKDNRFDFFDLFDRGDLSYRKNFHSVLHIAAEHWDESMVQTLIDRGIDVNVKSENNTTALHIASKNGLTEIVKLLLDKGADISAKTSDLNESTALHLGCLKEHFDIVKLLLERGASIDEQDKMGHSALFIAIERKRRTIVRILLDYGANVELKDKSGKSPLFYAIECYKNAKNRYLEQDMIYYVGIIEQLLDHSGANYNNEDVFPLEVAINHHDSDVTEMLLHYGADVNKPTKDGDSVIKFTGFGVNADDDILKMLDFVVHGLEPMKIVIQHVVKLLSKRVSVSEDDLNLIKSNAYYLDHQKSCQEEIDRMKSERFGNSAILYYDLLTSDNQSQLAAFAKNKDVQQVFESNEHYTKFPLYKDSLNYQMKKGIYRELLLSKVRYFFHAVANAEGNSGLPKLPIFCITEIFSYLRNRDLRTLMCVCNIKLYTEIFDFTFDSD